MARYPLNQPIRLSTTVKDVTGTLVNAGTLVLTVQWPDATQHNYSTPVNDSAGLYHQDVAVTDLAILGHYQYIWTATGTGAGVSFGDFDVFGPFEPAVLPLQDAYDALNIPAAQQTAANGAEIGQYIATIETSLEAMTGGPLVNRAVTERAEFSCDMLNIQVRQRPLVSVTSITSIPNSALVDISGGLDLDPLTGIIRQQGGWAFSAFSRLADITYIAGWGVAVPAAFNTAGRIILQNLWETQHGPSARPQMGVQGDMVTMPGFGFLIPSQAAEILGGTLGGLPFTLGGAVFA